MIYYDIKIRSSVFPINLPHVSNISELEEAIYLTLKRMKTIFKSKRKRRFRTRKDYFPNDVDDIHRGLG